MKKHKFIFVPQKYESDCVIACIAMITGQHINKILYYFQNDFDKKGISTDFAITYINNFGISMAEKRTNGFVDLEKSNKILLRPFADIHLVSGKQYIDGKINHSVIMSKNGELFDPACKKRKDWKVFYEIIRIIGCYYL